MTITLTSAASTNVNVKVNAAPRRSRPKYVVFTAPYYGKETLWEVYPDNWPTEKAPLLGYVRADSEYWAKYAAYDSGLLPYNASFGPAVSPAKNKTLFINKASDVRIPSVYQ